MDRMVMGLPRWRSCLALGTALAIWGSGSSAMAQAPAVPEPTVAIFPLNNNSGDAAQDFFAGGLTDDIASALSRVRGLGVVARSSSFALKPSDRDAKAIGQSLNARYLLQGTARTAGDRVQLNVRLVQASDGAQLWAHDYDGKLSDIFELEEDIG